MIDVRGVVPPAGNTRRSPAPTKSVTVKFTEIAWAVVGMPHWAGTPGTVPVIWNVRCPPAIRDGGPAWPVQPKPRVSMMRQGTIPTNVRAWVTSAGDAIEPRVFVEVAFEVTVTFGANTVAVFPVPLAVVFPGVLPDTLGPEAVPLGWANTNADAGMPPNLSASAAFNAYGTLTSKTRGPSTSPGNCICTPNQRGAPELNSPSGSPSLLVAPSSTV